MLNIGSGSKVFLIAGPTDMRKSYDTLAAVVRAVINADPLLCVEHKYVAVRHKHPANLLKAW